MNSSRRHTKIQILFKEISRRGLWALTVHQAGGQSITVNTKRRNSCPCLLWQTLCFFRTAFRCSDVGVILPFDVRANTTVIFSQHATAGAVVFRRMYRWDSQHGMPPAPFLHLQACSGRLRSSGRNGERSTIQSLFSKHQHLKTIRRKSAFIPGCQCFLLARGSSQNSFISCCSTSQEPSCYIQELWIYRTFTQHFSSLKWCRKNIFVPSLKGKQCCTGLIDSEAVAV